MSNPRAPIIIPSIEHYIAGAKVPRTVARRIRREADIWFRCWFAPDEMAVTVTHRGPVDTHIVPKAAVKDHPNASH